MRCIYPCMIITCLLMLTSCQRNEPCHPLQGSWISDEGQKLIFAEGGKAALITYFGATSRDTFFATVHYPCKGSPGTLDLLPDTAHNRIINYRFFGLIAWSGDTAFSLHMVKGRDDSVRPPVFELSEARKFYREK